MDRLTEDYLKTSLTEALEAWLDQPRQRATTAVVLPYFGENTAEIMANAALSVLRGIADAQTYLEANGLIKP